MDNDNNKNPEGTEDILRMDILVDKMEIYRIMSHVFFRRLDKEEVIDALIEAAEQIREEGLNVKKD